MDVVKSLAAVTWYQRKQVILSPQFLKLFFYREHVYTSDIYFLHSFFQIKSFPIFCLQLSCLTVGCRQYKQILEDRFEDFVAEHRRLPSLILFGMFLKGETLLETLLGHLSKIRMNRSFLVSYLTNIYILFIRFPLPVQPATISPVLKEMTNVS